MIEADLEDPRHLARLLRAGLIDQVAHPGIHMGAIRAYFRRVRPRDEATLGPGVSRARGYIIGIEQIAEPRIERLVRRGVGNEQEVFEEPRRMRPVPLSRARIPHALHRLVLGRWPRGP